MARAVLRSLLVAAITVAVGLAGHAAYFALCPRHRAFDRVARGATRVILDGGYGVARAGDRVFACTVQHCFAPGWCHRDARCSCAAGLDARAVAARLGDAGECRLDEGEACPGARCEDHFDP
jgi:hypothetical protein